MRNAGATLGRNSLTSAAVQIFVQVLQNPPSALLMTNSL